MSHFKPTSRGEDLGEHLDVFRPLLCSGGSLPQKKNPSWEEPLQKSQFLTGTSLKMSHFRPTLRGGPGKAPGCLQVDLGQMRWKWLKLQPNFGRHVFDLSTFGPAEDGYKLGFCSQNRRFLSIRQTSGGVCMHAFRCFARFLDESDDARASSKMNVLEPTPSFSFWGGVKSAATQQSGDERKSE